MSDQPKPEGEVMVAGCEITGGSSRVCEHGQKSCEIRHTKPATGEWTAATLEEEREHIGWQALAERINAALAAAKENSLREILDWERGYKCGKAECAVVIDQLQSQLVNDRERVRVLEEAMNCVHFIQQTEPKPASGEHSTAARETFQDIAPTTGEWTAEYVDNLLGQIIAHGVVKVADAHNAALAAFREGKARCEKQLDATMKQLAAEKEKVQTLTDALTWMDESVLVNQKNWIRAEDNPGFHRHE